MKKILFVCHGNICRSPMAEFIMKRMVDEASMASAFEIASAATSTEEIGNAVYPPARRMLAEHGITCEGKTARQITRQDYAYYDVIVAMDDNNLRNLHRLLGDDDEGKIRKLLARDVADPWYTGNFDATWRDCVEGCKHLLDQLSKQ